MKLTKGTLRRIIKEESRRLTEKEEYKQFFKRALEKAGKSIPQMSDSEKKEFFNKIDKAWKAKNESVNEARTVSKPIKVDNETMVQIVGDNKGFRELTAALNPKTGKPVQKFGYDRGNEIADSKEELVKKLQKKYGKSIKFESVNEGKDDFVARHGKANIILKKGYKHHKDTDLEKLYYKLGSLVKGLKVKDVTLVFESVVNEKKVPKKGSPDYHQHKIAVDTVRNPIKSFMGGPSSKEAEETLIKKFGYSKKEVDKLRESVNEAKNLKKAKQALIDFNLGKLGEDEMVKTVIKSLGFKFDKYSEEEAGVVLSSLIKKGKIPTDNYVLNNVINVLEESVNEENINEIGVLGIAGGIALGLAGFLALAKGSYWAKAKLGNTIYNVADKLERRVRRIESEKTQKSIMDIAKKFENDKKLMDMYQSLPKYRSGSKNSVRNKGLRQIAKYVKSKLNDEEMQYFYQVNTLLRTGKLESAHDELKTKSINEAKSQDPTLKEMVKFLKSNYRDEEEFSILLAIYFYSEANHGGMRSNLYSALSQLSNKMRVRTKFSDERGTEIEMMVDDLVDEFGGERP